MMWNVLDAANDANFDSSSSLTEGLWGVFKHKISNQLAHLLIVSDVWRVSDESLSKLWCDFVTDNYDDRLMSFNSSNSLVQMPVGFSSCTRPFGRLLSLLDTYFVQGTDSRLNTPLHWLLNRIATNKDENSQEVKQVYNFSLIIYSVPFSSPFSFIKNSKFVILGFLFLGLLFRLVSTLHSTAFASLHEESTIVKNGSSRRQSFRRSTRVFHRMGTFGS